MYSVIMGHLGEDIVAANSVVNTVRQLGSVLCFGMAYGGAIVVGKSMGAGDMELAESMLKYVIGYVLEQAPLEMEFLNKFFGNLLLGEKNLLDNREMQIKSEKSSQKSSQKTTQKSSQKILELVAQNPNITTTKMAEILGISRRAVAKQITTLKENGKLRRIGPDKGGHWEVVEE